MLNRLLIGWVVYAGLVGFVLGGSYVSAYLIPLPQHQSSTNNESATEQSSKEETDKALARYTLWLMAFTGGLFLATVALCLATIGLYVTGEKQIEVALKAANAAELSAKAAIAIELPIIRAEPDGFGWGRRQNPGSRAIDSFGIDRLGFANLGRTKAFPIEIRFGYTVGNRLPAVPVYPFTKAFSVNVVIESEPLLKNLMEFEFDTAADTFDGLRTGSTRLWFYCSLIYLDFMQNRHEAAFCWERWQAPGDGGFREDQTPAYNVKI